MSKFWQKLLYPVLPILLAVLTWYIQLMVPDGDIWPFNSWGWTESLYPTFFTYRIQIGAGATIFVVLSFVITGFCIGRKRRRSLFNKIFTQIFEEKLQSNYESYRLTLFYPRNWFYMLGIWFRRTFLNAVPHLKNRCFWIHFFEIPLPWKTYMSIEYRLGQPYEGNSNTFFKIPTCEDDFEGFSSYIWYRKTADCVSLPNLSDIPIRTLDDMKKLSAQKRNKVQDYMKKGKVKDFKKLRTIHRLPLHLWGSPLLSKNQDIGAILILDSVDESSDIFGNGLGENLLSFSRLLETVIGEY